MEDELDALGARGRVDRGRRAAGRRGGHPAGRVHRVARREPRAARAPAPGAHGELLPLLASRELDLVVGRLYAPAVPDGLQRVPMWEEPIAVLARAGHPLLRPGAARDGHGARRARVGAAHRQPARRAGDRAPARPARPAAGRGARSSSYGFIREMLLASNAVSIMPRSMMVGILLRGALRVAPLPVPAPPRPAGSSCPPIRRPPRQFPPSSRRCARIWRRSRRAAASAVCRILIPGDAEG